MRIRSILSAARWWEGATIVVSSDELIDTAAPTFTLLYFLTPIFAELRDLLSLLINL